MNPIRWLGEKLGLIQSAQDELVLDAAVKLRLLGALTRAHTRHQVEEYLTELEAAGHTSLAVKVREELAASGLLPHGRPPSPVAVAVTVAQQMPAALPQAPDTDIEDPAGTTPRKRGRPRKNPSPDEPFRSGPTR